VLVAADDRARTGGEEDLRHGGPGGTTAGGHDLDVFQALADDAQRVEERCEHDDRRAVLVVVEDGDVQFVAQPPLDFEAARRGDVLEVDPAEPRCDRLHDRDDLVRVACVEADREGVEAAELLEQHRLAFHHGQRCFRPDVTEAQHRGAVGHDGDHVLLRGQRPHLLRVVGDRAADTRHAGGVRHGEIVTRLQR